MNRVLGWWRKRRDESDVRIDPDAGSVPSSHARRSSVRGARQALRQIDTELAVTPGAASALHLTEFFAAEHRYQADTVPGLRMFAADCFGQADEDDLRAAELADRAASLVAQAAGLRQRAALKRRSAEDHLRVAQLAELDAQAPAPEVVDDRQAAVPVAESADRGEVVDERMRGMGGPSAAETVRLPRVNPFGEWRPGPADVPGPAAVVGDTRVPPVFDAAGGVR